MPMEAGTSSKHFPTEISFSFSFQVTFIQSFHIINLSSQNMTYNLQLGHSYELC